MLALTAWAADFDYRVGTAAAESARAVAIEDRRGNRLVLVEADFPVTLTIADAAAIQLAKAYGLDRPAMLFRGGGQQPARPADLVAAATEALIHREPARIRRTPSGLSIEARRCVAVLFPIAFENCAAGTEVRGEIRAAFQIVEPPHGLLRRGEPEPLYPVQAIAFGKGAVILALGGNEAVDVPGVIVVRNANDDLSPPDHPWIQTAIRQVLARVGH